MAIIQRVVGISSIVIIGFLGSCFAAQQKVAIQEPSTLTPIVVTQQSSDTMHMLINKLAGVRGVQVAESADTITITLDYDTVLYSR